jgi:hypothetical protein
MSVGPATSGPAAAGPDLAAWPPLEGVVARHGPALLDWATGPGHPKVCLVKGAQGSGKSQLLAWFLAGSASHPRTTVHAAVLSEGLFAEAFAWDAGRQLGFGPLSSAGLLHRLAVDRRPLLVLVPDLHRAGRGPADRPSANPATLVRELVLPLLELPQTRAVIEVGDSGLFDGWMYPAEIIELGTKVHRTAYGTPRNPVVGGDLTAQVPRYPDGRPRWDLATDDAREHALDQALLAPDPVRAVSELITDPGFLLHGSAVSIAACLVDERIPAPSGLRRTWRQAAPQLSDLEHSTVQRAALLHQAALGTDPSLARHLLPLAQEHVFTALWGRPDAIVTALAPVPSAAGELVAGDPLGGLTRLDAATGGSSATVPGTPASTARPQGIAVRPDRSLLLLSDTGTLTPVGQGPVHATADGTAGFGRIASHHGQAALVTPDLTPTALGQSPDGTLTVVGDGQGAVHVWRLDDPHASPHSHTLHPAPVAAVTGLDLPDEHLTLVMSAGMDGTVRIWEMSTDPMPSPVEQRPALVSAMAATVTADGPVLAIAWNDASLHLWNVLTGRVRRIPLLSPCSALALSADVDSRLCRLAVGGPEGTYALRLDTARLWN